jgi:methionyl-tRNA formyltransferase
MRQIENNQKIAVLTSEGNQFVPYAKELVETLNCRNYESNLFYKHEEINEDFEIVFILSYGKIIEKTYLVKHKHNIVVHGSDLPKGSGWSPIFWQILGGKNGIPIVLFEASEKDV